MGLFDSLRSAGAPTFDAQSSIMTIVLAAMKADGSIDDEEVVRLRTMCARSPIFAANSRERDDEIIAFADKVTEQFGVASIEMAVKNLKQELRETGFAFACEMVLADGMVSDAEERYLTNLATSLGIPNATLSALVLATIVRNRGL